MQNEKGVSVYNLHTIIIYLYRVRNFGIVYSASRTQRFHFSLTKEKKIHFFVVLQPKLNEKEINYNPIKNWKL